MGAVGPRAELPEPIAHVVVVIEPKVFVQILLNQLDVLERELADGLVKQRVMRIEPAGISAGASPNVWMESIRPLTAAA